MSVLALNKVSVHLRQLAPVLIVAALGLLTACGGEVGVLPTKTTVANTKIVRDIGPQSQSLVLRLTSPQTNLITDADQITVAGTTSPDATLSVNGRLVLPDAEGNFSTDFELSAAVNPLVINVIATSITGESEIVVRPVVFLNEPNVSKRYGGPGKSAVFGTVTSVTPSGFTLQTNDGPVTLTADANTVVSIHGWESPSHTDLENDADIVVVTVGQQALSALNVLARPARTRHFTGIVTGSALDQSTGLPSLTLQDGSGRQITASIEGDLAGESKISGLIGTVVTAVLEQDIATGVLRVTGIDPALNAADRIFDALTLNQSIESPDAPVNISALRWRLAEHGVRNISMLVNGQPFDGSAKAIAQADDVYTKLFSGHHIGAPAADVTGLVTAIATSLGNSATRLITIQPDSGQPVKIKISGATPVALFGERIKSGQLDLASRITVRYGISGNNATRVTVMAGNTLSEESSIQLAVRAVKGEIQGTLTQVGPMAAVITVLDRTSGEKVSLQSSGVSIYKNGTPTKLTTSMEGTSVIARFDPGSYRLLDLETLAVQRNEDAVSGVIHSFIPKVASGNITLRMSDGQLQSFSHDTSTAIRRDGLNVSIHDVRLGDLVRPNTRVTSSAASGGQHQEIVFLSLKTPEPGLITGIIRGVSVGLNGQVRVTVSNIWLDLIALTVNSDTAITQQGRILGAQDLSVGQAIALGSYNPVTMEAGILAVEPSKDVEMASISSGGS